MMRKGLKGILAVAFFISGLLNAQNADPVLFKVEDTPVHLSEFEYIYGKNNGDDADYSRKSVEEYLDLYIKFKLKVERAREMKLDTIPALIKELQGYRRQLASSYLTDKEVTERLTHELYDRMKWDIDISHILFSVSNNAVPEDTLAMFEKAMAAYKMITEEGANFEHLAAQMSADKQSAKHGGRLGFVTAKLPNGFYRVESTIYTGKPGEVYGPVRSDVGYHLVKVHEKRPARGKMEAAHILLRKKVTGKRDAFTEQKIEQIYKKLLEGESFERMVALHSEDESTTGKGGNIGVFSINQYERSFEDAAFALEEDGQFSKPVETSIGYHIIKRIRKMELEPFDRIRRRLQAEIIRDSRYEIARESLINRIKKENGYQKFDEALTRYEEGVGDDFLSYKWRMSEYMKREPLFRIGDREYSTLDFSNYLRSNSRTRLSLDKKTETKEAVLILYEEFVKDMCIDFEESILESKYPDFKSLMREYEEGILLFEATKLAVWEKAPKDTVGLEAFYERNKRNYLWKERAMIQSISLKGGDEKWRNKFYTLCEKKGYEHAEKKYSKPFESLSTEENLVEYEKRNEMFFEGLKMETGSISPMVTDEATGVTHFRMITEMHQPEPKSLSEARGYIIADYQEELEENWVAELKSSYHVEVNQNILESIIKE